MRAFSLIVFVSALAGCERVAADRADAQLVARVNGIEISARQVRSGGAPGVAQAVEKIIDPELLGQKALEAGPTAHPPGEKTHGKAPPPGLGQADTQRPPRPQKARAAHPPRPGRA